MLTDANAPAPEAAASEAAPAPSWTESLSEDIRGNETLAKYDSLDGFVQDALKERNDYAALQTRVAVPEAYEFNTEGLNPEAIEKYTGLAKELGLSQEQYQKILEFSINQGKTAKEAEAVQKQQTAELKKQKDTEELTNATNAFRQEWGANYDKNMAGVNRTLSKFGEESLTNLLDKSGKELAEVLGESKLGNYPALARTFHRLASTLSEDQFATDGTQQTTSNARRDASGNRMLSFPSMQKQT